MVKTNRQLEHAFCVFKPEKLSSIFFVYAATIESTLRQDLICITWITRTINKNLFVQTH